MDNFSVNNYVRDLSEIIAERNQLNTIVKKFNAIFIKNGWCAYGSLDYELILKAIKTEEQSGIKEAEKVLIHYFCNEENINTKPFRYLEPFKKREKQLNDFFKSHFEGDYSKSILLGLPIVDGVVNDVTRKEGFYSQKTDLEIKTDFVEIHQGLPLLQRLFTKMRSKSNEERIEIPYRNGILHGRELNYDNEYVSSKIVALMFAVADWIVEVEKEVKEENHQSFMDTICLYNDVVKLREELNQWKPKKITIDSQKNNEIDECINADYLIPITNFFKEWKNEEYGNLLNTLEKCFHEKAPKKDRIELCKDLFKDKKLITYKLLTLEEVSPVISIIKTEARWDFQNFDIVEKLSFRVGYGDIHDTFAAPLRDNAEWKIIMFEEHKIANSVLKK